MSITFSLNLVTAKKLAEYHMGGSGGDVVMVVMVMVVVVGWGGDGGVGW